jgi:hypothetical protein
VFAADSTGKVKENKVVINEYEYFKELSLKSESELSDMGCSAKEISEIRNYHKNYVDHLNRLKKLDDTTLSKLGYTSEQIAIFRNFDGSETQAILLSASLNLTSTTSNFRYENTYSKGKLAYLWTWDGLPWYGLQDAVVASWNDWVVESKYSAIDYYNTQTGQYYTTRSGTFTTDGNGTEGAGHKFPLKINDNLHYAKTGYGYFNIRSDVHAIKDFYYYIAYGHSEIWPTISFSIGTGGAAASISFTFGTVIEDSETGSYIF